MGKNETDLTVSENKSPAHLTGLPGLSTIVNEMMAGVHLLTGRTEPLPNVTKI
jgi:hypothetical protein